MTDINKMQGVAKPVGVSVVDGSSGSGTCVYLLKKSKWLRLFHILTFQDTSAFLLDPFGRPVSFNRAEVGDMFIGSLETSILEGYKVSYCVDAARVRIEYKASLSMLCLCPWIYTDDMECTLTIGDDYRIGRAKIESRVITGLKAIEHGVFEERTA